MKLKRIITVGLSSLAIVLSPMNIYADSTVYATDASGNQYTSIDDAWNAAKSGTEITMMQDWNLESRLISDENQTIIINMNGYKIDRNRNGDLCSNGEVIYLDEGTNLTLNGSEDRKFYFRGYNGSKKLSNVSLTSGGLVTGGASNDGGGIHMKKGSTLTLNHVAVAGNEYSIDKTDKGNGGGIDMSSDNCTVNLNNSLVEYNYSSESGGGIQVDGKNGKISLNNSQVSYNTSYDGGGIYSDCTGTQIELSNNSSISHNTATSCGGGIYFEDTDYSIKSVDEDTSKLINQVNSNTASTSGGGIFVEGESIGSNSGEISGLLFESNVAGSSTSHGYGGAIWVAQENCTISNCYFTNNTATTWGGAIRNTNDDNTIENCEIINNKAGEEGGGIYCDEEYDITLSGKVVIKDNKRSGEYSDDLFLQKTWYATAYVKGEVSNDSQVGIRTGTDGTTQIGKDISSDCSSCFFLNDSGDYHISYSDGKLYKSNGLTGSIFSDGNGIVAGCVMGGIVVIGAVFLVLNKKKNQGKA